VAGSGYEVHRFASIGSTNDWALAAARDGAPDGTIAVADVQHAGRGRLDRRWEAPEGSALLCSVLLRVTLAPEDRHLCTVAVALAALDACAETAGVRVGLKWPNDLVVEDRKLAGILAESDGVAAADGTTAIVVGLGLNLTWPGPPGVGGTSLLAETGRTVERDAFLAALLAALQGFDAELRDETGRLQLMAQYRARLVTLGREVRVELHDGVVYGVARGVTSAGHLVVETTDGARELSVGDVVHLRAGTSREFDRE
jgi:BirA family biotin operon repressor/biotin-[acetyl-CoA-carboxylase] ligase